MPKPTRGLPDNFQLDVPAEVLRGPVQLGDYMDEQLAPPIARPQPAPQPSPVARMADARPAQLRAPVSPPPTRPEPVSLPQASPQSYEPQHPTPVAQIRSVQYPPDPLPQSETPESVQPFVPSSGSWSKRITRKQFNLNPETLRMVDELIQHIQSQSVQKDTKASEVFHALVAALYDAREYLNFADVPARGKWGTPTAFAFPIALKNAFQSAISQWAARYGR